MSDQANTTSPTDAAAEGAPLNRDASAKPVWLVEHPTHQYLEDVKALARQHGLQVVDEAAAGDDERARAKGERPRLTLRSQAAKDGKGAELPKAPGTPKKSA